MKVRSEASAGQEISLPNPQIGRMDIDDLPISVWAGRSPAFDADGLLRLSFAGCSHARQGVEVLESLGAADEETTPRDDKINGNAVAMATAEHPSPLGLEETADGR